jgi:hypothetical protein
MARPRTGKKQERRQKDPVLVIGAQLSGFLMGGPILSQVLCKHEICYHTRTCWQMHAVYLSQLLCRLRGSGTVGVQPPHDRPLGRAAQGAEEAALLARQALHQCAQVPGVRLRRALCIHDKFIPGFCQLESKTEVSVGTQSVPAPCGSISGSWYTSNPKKRGNITCKALMLWKCCGSPRKGGRTGAGRTTG